LYDFIILTTAVTRPDLHKRIFSRNLQFVEGMSVKWLINIDYINNEHTVSDTIKNFKSLFLNASNIDAEFFCTDGASCFFSAAKRLALRAQELLPECKTGVLWLEDDWEINQKTAYSQFLSKLRLKRTRNLLNKKVLSCTGNLKQKQLMLEEQGYTEDSLWFVSLVPRVGVSFNPGIWSKAMFTKGFYGKLASTSENQIDDPETLCADPYNEEYAYKEITILADPIFQDAGRRWSAEVGLEKWKKQQSVLFEQGAVTYAKQLTVSALNKEQSNHLIGFFLLPDILFNSPLKLVAKTAYVGEGRLKVRLLAIPYLSLELRVTERWKTDVHINRMHHWAQIYPYDKAPVIINWYFDKSTELLDAIEVEFSKRRFIAVYNDKIPLCSIWMAPIQAIVGGIIYIFSLIRITNGLEKR